MADTHNAGKVPMWDLWDQMQRSLRHAGVGVQEIADELGMSRNSIGNYLAGRRQPTRAVLIAWASVCGVSLAWLATGEEPRHGS